MRRALPIIAALLMAVPLSGCVVAAIPVAAGAAMIRSESKRKQNRVAVPAPPPAAAAPTDTGGADAGKPASVIRIDVLPTPTDGNSAFAALMSHVDRRAALWREGAPINSLVLDARQTVLNPVAVGCARRPPVVIIDLDPAGVATASASGAEWPAALARLRAADVAIVWISEQSSTAAAPLRAQLAVSGLDPAGQDRLVLRQDGASRKQTMRQTIANDSCVLAVVGDVRADADEAYAYLRSPDARLPIDSNWGEGWFLLPPPLASLEPKGPTP